MISESGLVISDAVITKMDEPQIGVKFVPDYGIIYFKLTKYFL